MHWFVRCDFSTAHNQARGAACSLYCLPLGWGGHPEVVASMHISSLCGGPKGTLFPYGLFPPPSLWSRWQPWGAVPAHPHHPDAPLPGLWPCGDELFQGPVPASHQGGRPVAAYHTDEERPGLWVQGRIWGKRPSLGVKKKLVAQCDL